jgi:hypothetical protein
MFGYSIFGTGLLKVTDPTGFLILSGKAIQILYASRNSIRKKNLVEMPKIPFSLNQF